MAELADPDPEGKINDHFDMIDDFLIGAGMPISGPVLLSLDALKRVIILEGLEARAVDLGPNTKAEVVAVAAGPHFRG